MSDISMDDLFKESKEKIKKIYDNKGIYSLYHYMPTFVDHIKSIHESDPDLSSIEINKILLQEMDIYSDLVFENSFALDYYFDYICRKMLVLDHDKFDEISQKLKKNPKYYDNLKYGDCKNMDDYLSVFVYSQKKLLYKKFSNELGEFLPDTPESYVNIDSSINDNIYNIAKSFFKQYFNNSLLCDELAHILKSDDSFNQKKKIENFIKMHVTSFQKNKFRLDCESLMEGSFAYMKATEKENVANLRKSLAKSTSNIVNALDELGVLDSYLSNYVVSMISMGAPELASCICKNPYPTEEMINSVLQSQKRKKDLENNVYFKNKASGLKKLYKINKRQADNKFLKIKNDFSQYIDKDLFKSYLSEGYLSSAVNSLPLESLLALNIFWSNRYIKAFDTYSQALYAAHKYDIVNKVLNNSSTYIPIKGLKLSMTQMNIFYKSSKLFFDYVHKDNPSEVSITTDSKNILRFSYQPYVDTIANYFGEENYSDYFSKTMPYCSSHDLKTDAYYSVRLNNPIYASYKIKNEFINALLINMCDERFNSFPNAGVVLENKFGESMENKNGTRSVVPRLVVFGMDCSLSSPVRVHADRDLMMEFLRSLNKECIVPIYEHPEDFHDIYNYDKPMSTAIVVPVTERIQKNFKKYIKYADDPSSQYYHPNAKFLSHLAFENLKKVPDHMKNSSGDKNANFNRRYIDLTNGHVHINENGQFIDCHLPVTPHADGEFNGR